MRITKIIKQAQDGPYDCTGGSCPALLLTDSDQVIIQGLTLDSLTRSNISLPEGEDVIRMSLTTFRSLVSQLD